MAPRAVKRRKVKHNVSDDEEDSTSFASFGEESEDQHCVERVEEDEAESEDKLMKDGDDENGNDDEFEGKSVDGQNEQSQVPSTLQHRKTVARKDAASAPFVAGNHKSTMFKLQLDDLLEQLRPRRGKTELAAEAALHSLKSVIESIPDKGPLGVDEAESQLFSSSKVQIPFPDPRPPKDAKYKFRYATPSNVNVVGSHVLKTSSRSKKMLEIDMVITMPSSVFQEKDYLDFRYFYKRAYYLASIAAGLNTAVGTQYNIKVYNFHSNLLKPILVVTPVNNPGSEGGPIPSHRWQINVIPCIAEDIFQPEKLNLNRACVRHQSTLSNSGADGHETPKATPFYNSSIRSDMLTISYLKL
jgi:U3 small nucleolar RNA-associated protein 22